MYKDIISFSPDFDAAEGSENRLGVDVSVVLQTGVRVFLIGGRGTEACDFYLSCVLYFLAVQCAFVDF